MANKFPIPNKVYRYYGPGKFVEEIVEEDAAGYVYNVGDVNSEERGSGARANSGKMQLEYVPVDLWTELGLVPAGWGEVVSMLSDFQKGRTNVIFDVVAHLSPNLDLACKVFDYGAKKYATWNWAKGMPWSVPLACIGRHLKAIKDGEEVDAESGVHHAGHILCNVIMLAHFAAHYPEGDDRPLKTCFKEPVYEG